MQADHLGRIEQMEPRESTLHKQTPNGIPRRQTVSSVAAHVLTTSSFSAHDVHAVYVCNHIPHLSSTMLQRRTTILYSN
jgi:hypothetical protein